MTSRPLIIWRKRECIIPREVEKSLGNDESARIKQVGSRQHRQHHHGRAPQNHLLRINDNNLINSVKFRLLVKCNILDGGFDVISWQNKTRRRKQKKQQQSEHNNRTHETECAHIKKCRIGCFVFFRWHFQLANPFTFFFG